MRNILAGFIIQLILLGLFFVTSPGFAATEAILQKSIEVHGHRGARGKRPENTLPAFKFALEAGVDTLELDLAVSKDNELIISHDPQINETLCLRENGSKVPANLFIRQLRLHEIQRFDCGSLQNPKFPKQKPVPGTPILSLRELFQFVKSAGKPVRFNIETKIYADRPQLTPSPEVFAKMVIELIKEFNLIERSTMQSFDARTIVAAKKLEPKLKTALLVNQPNLDYLNLVKAAGADIFSPAYQLVNAQLVDRFHRAGIPVIVWTANEPAVWRALLDSQVDGIISDVPDDLMAYLASTDSMRESKPGSVAE